MTLVTLDEIEAARQRIRHSCVRTPLVVLGGPRPEPSVWLKPESLQPTGAFKLRGALNAVALLDPDRRAHGVVTHSSGNHGQAVAYAARATGITATVLMPEGSVPRKIDATRALGAQVLVVPVADRQRACEEWAERTGASVIPPFDDLRVIAGQGTVGLEIVDDLDDVDTVLVPVGGGGLISGVAAAVKARRPQARVIGCEPELAGDLAEGFAAGQRATWSPERTGRTIADGLRVSAVGLHNWAHICALVDDVVTVGEDSIRAAVREIAVRSHLVAEPSGAVTTAAYLEHGSALPAGKTVAVLSGGNIDPALFGAILNTCEETGDMTAGNR
jgi:threonine dehydratase